MLQIENFLYASDLAEAYDTLQTVPGSVILGGCGYLRLGARKIGTAIDLSRLGLGYVAEVDNTVEIGAMTSLHTIETHPLTSSLWSGVLNSAVRNIVGVQLRNRLCGVECGCGQVHRQLSHCCRQPSWTRHAREGCSSIPAAQRAGQYNRSRSRQAGS